MGVANVASSAEELFASPSRDVVYIGSNDDSHAKYAVTALRTGKPMYVETPMAVSQEQIRPLSSTYRTCGKSVFAGYNRRFSRAGRDIRSRLSSPEGPLTLGCFVSGHRLAADHWYRRPKEGTRIRGNSEAS
jgi:predicted dehydrogenase